MNAGLWELTAHIGRKREGGHREQRDDDQRLLDAGEQAVGAHGEPADDHRGSGQRKDEVEKEGLSRTLPEPAEGAADAALHRSDEPFNRVENTDQELVHVVYRIPSSLVLTWA